MKISSMPEDWILGSFFLWRDHCDQGKHWIYILGSNYFWGDAVFYGGGECVNNGTAHNVRI